MVLDDAADAWWCDGDGNRYAASVFDDMVRGLVRVASALVSAIS